MIEGAVVRLHRLLGSDVNDPRTTAYVDVFPFGIRYLPWSEANAGAPVHLLFVVLAALLLPLRVLRDRSAGVISRSEGTRLGLLLVAALGGLVLFSLLVKWQPWHPRLQIGLVSLLAVFAAAVLCRGRGLGAVIVCGLLLVPLVPAAIRHDASRPLLGPRSVVQQPRDRHLLRPDEWSAAEEVLRLADAIQPRVVGMRIPSEYVFQYRLARDLKMRPTFTDPLAPINRPVFHPWPRPDIAIIWGGDHPKFHDRSSSETMYRIARPAPYAVYVPAEVALELHHRGIIDELPDSLPQHMRGAP
jgi:hypothetical protein